MMKSPLLAIIQQRIAESGPLTLAEYMTLALAHPEHGYYKKRTVFGAKGDFITAPEVSQMFGEMIAGWILDLWQRSGQPLPLMLTELGPGRGTLMADVTRTALKLGLPPQALSLELVETSPQLRRLQKEKLDAFGVSCTWHDSVDHLSDGPHFIVANEFFDALPIRQFQRDREGFHEIMVGVANEKLAYVRSPLAVDERLIPKHYRHVGQGEIVETSDAARQIIDQISSRIATSGGAALIIDYGHTEGATGDTFQAVRNHAFTDPLDAPGFADLTSHVNFAIMAIDALERGLAVYGPSTQGAFLNALGMAERARKLAGGEQKKTNEDIRSAYERLTDEAKMGQLFKVLAIVPQQSPAPAGLTRFRTEKGSHVSGSD